MEPALTDVRGLWYFWLTPTTRAMYSGGQKVISACTPVKVIPVCFRLPCPGQGRPRMTGTLAVSGPRSCLAGVVPHETHAWATAAAPTPVGAALRKWLVKFDNAIYHFLGVEIDVERGSTTLTHSTPPRS